MVKYFLKDIRCPKCKTESIAVFAYKNMESNRLENGSGACQLCFREIILPSEDLYDFVKEHCRKVMYVMY